MPTKKQTSRTSRRAPAVKRPTRVVAQHQSFLQRLIHSSPAVLFAVIFAVVGIGVISYSFAATPAEQQKPTVKAIAGGRILQVSSSASLQYALNMAKPGDQIRISDGRYKGHFTSIRSGSASAPIILMGTRSAILDGTNIKKDIGLHLGSANSPNAIGYWKLQGFTVTNTSLGILFDNVRYSSINKVQVSGIGAEGIHLRGFSSNNTLSSNLITNTGKSKQGFGEGIYVGSAVSNWGNSSLGKPDRSNANKIINNTIHHTGAEAIDIKEGTHDGIVQGNTLNGVGMCSNRTQTCTSASSLINVKGEGWKIVGNAGSNVSVVWDTGTPTNDGFKAVAIAKTGKEGSGTNNYFSKNRINNVGGYGFNMMSKGNTVKCDNKVTKAGKGFSNQKCKD